MSKMHQESKSTSWLTIAVASAIASMGALGTGPAHADDGGGGGTATQINHVIVVVGENHTYDNVYGGYVPQHGQTVWNLLSEGIINSDGSPGPHFSDATQNNANDTTVTPGTYSPTPPTSPGSAT